MRKRFVSIFLGVAALVCIAQCSYGLDAVCYIFVPTDTYEDPGDCYRYFRGSFGCEKWYRTDAENEAECAKDTGLPYCNEVLCPPPNAAPTATPSITGSDCLTQELTGSYVYKDTDTPADAEDTAAVKFQWYTGTSASCAGKAAISGATSDKYTPTAADKGKFICFGVTPVALTGTKQGTEAIATTTAAVMMPGYASNPESGVVISLDGLSIGSSVSKTISVSEIGSAELKVTGTEITGTNAGDFSVTPATLTIADCGAAQDLTIKCTPSAAGGRTATLKVNHNAAGSPATYTVTCYGLPNAAPTATDLSITSDNCLTQELTGSYVYEDTDTPADAEDTAAVKFQW